MVKQSMKADLQLRLERALEALIRVQWVGIGDAGFFCPDCGGKVGTAHLDWCVLHEVLHDAELCNESRVRIVGQPPLAPSSGLAVSPPDPGGHEAAPIHVEPADPEPDLGTTSLGVDQQRAYDLAMSGKNVLISGPAGTGKSLVVRQIIEDLRGMNLSVAVTASTGVAALNIRGSTIHSFLGTAIKGTRFEVERNPPALRGKRGSHLARRLEGADVLVIDEISMLTGDYMDMTAWWLAHVRQVERARAPTRFGGLQLVLVGDFLQLPPVQKDDNLANRLYAFQAECWPHLDIHPVVLRENFRQQDAAFTEQLLELREGRVTPAARDLFAPCVGRNLDDPVRLVPHNATAQRINLQQLDRMPGTLYSSKADFSGHQAWIESLRKNCIAEEDLQLKPGAPIIFLKNDKELGIVNGMSDKVIAVKTGEVTARRSDGVVISVTKHTWELCDANEKVVASMKQYPLKLAWALTIHKSQGMTLDKVRCEVDHVFETGHAYVALSRVKTLDGLSLRDPVAENQFLACSEAMDFYRNLEGMA